MDINVTATPAPLKTPTLKDVARVARVHFTTVSLVLRGNPRIPLVTRERVLRAVRQLGYKRDPVLLALTARRENVRLPRSRPRIIFMTNRPNLAAFNNTAHMRYFLAGAKQQAEAMGYVCELMLVGDKRLSNDEIERRLAASGTQGIILGAFVPHRRCVVLDWSRYALVKIDSFFMPPAASLICNDQMQVVRVAIRRLQALGYRRIGMAVGKLDEETTHDLFAAGYLLELERSGAARIPLLHFNYLDDNADVIAPLTAWVRGQHLDAVVSNWHSIASNLRKGGFQVPGDVACACLCLSDPETDLAGVFQAHFTTGQKAAETLGLLIRSGQRGVPPDPSSTYIEGIWQDGASAPLCRADGRRGSR
jgi:LacI family transcriptional regulator